MGYKFEKEDRNYEDFASGRVFFTSMALHPFLQDCYQSRTKVLFQGAKVSEGNSVYLFL